MDRLGGRRVERWSDTGLDAVTVFLATWTVAYHVCLVLRLGTAWAVGLTVALVAASTLLLRHLTDTEVDSEVDSEVDADVDAEVDAKPGIGIPATPRGTA